MTDFHSHILPEMDDGSKSCKQSVSLLKEEEKRGVQKLVFTPHFYAYENNIKTFIEKREESFKKLSSALETDPVNIELYLGAEVYFFNEIWRVDDIEKLCIEGTNYMLVELPTRNPCSEVVVQALNALVTQKNIIPIIAHFERNLYEKGSLKCLKKFVESGILLQMNVSYINDFWTRKKAVSFFKKGIAGVLGTDIHSNFSSKKDYEKARSYLTKKLPAERIAKLEKKEQKILKNAKACYIPK